MRGATRAREWWGQDGRQSVRLAGMKKSTGAFVGASWRRQNERRVWQDGKR